MSFVEVDSLDKICADAVSACAGGPQFNLTLAYEFEVSLIGSEFVEILRERAAEWQKEEPPPHLPFSHGKFFRGERGIAYVLNELKAKNASRRALLSLVGMDDILGKGDQPVPSFMIMQFGIDGPVLYVTAYFRAIEVKRFLRTNITEICLVIRRIRQDFQKLKRVRLLILAFRAYQDEHFVLERASVDIQAPGVVALAVAQGEGRKLIEWLDEKKRNRSLIETRGLTEMANAMDGYPKVYSVRARVTLRSAVSVLTELRALRERASESDQIDRENARFVKCLDDVIGELRNGVGGD